MFFTIKNKKNRIYNNCYIVSKWYVCKIEDRIKNVCSIKDIVDKQAVIIESYFDMKQ